MFGYLLELARNLSYLFKSGFKELTKAGLVSAAFMRDTFRAHYNVLGRKLAPIETEILDTSPPKVRSLSILGQFALLPLILLSWAVSLTVAPMIYNSILLLITGFIRVTNLALLDQPKSLQLPNPEGSMPWYRLLFGIPGFVIGGTLGLVAAGAIGLVRVVINSAQSARRSFFTMLNIALDPLKQNKEYLHDKRPGYMKYALGLPGVILGGMVGFIASLVTGFSRFCIHSLITARSLTFSVVNAVLRKEDELPWALKDDKRLNVHKYLLGFPGLIVGSISAVFGIGIAGFQRILVESWKSAKPIYLAIVAKAMAAKDDQDKAILEQAETKPRSIVAHYVLGSPGLLLGVLSGAVGFTAVIFARIVSNSALTTISLTVSGINVARRQNQQLRHDLAHDQRSATNKYAFGFPGLIIGGVAAAMGVAVGGVGRMTTASWKNSERSFWTIVNLALPAAQRKAQPEPQGSKLDRYVYGAPGLLLGGFAGVLGFSMVGLGRIAINSLITAKSITFSAINVVLHKEKQIKWALEQDKRSNALKYGLGFLGLIPGSITAVLGIGIATVQRMLVESWKTAKPLFKSIVKRALSKLEVEAEMALEQPVLKTRSLLDSYVFGAPGLVFGVLFGAMGYAGVMFARIIRDTSLTIMGLTVSGINLARSNKKPLRGALEQDPRPAYRIYGLGFAGLIVGGFTASLGLVISGLARVVVESYRSSLPVYWTIIKKASSAEKSDYASAILSSQSSSLDKYVFGAPGILIGAILGGLGFMMVGTGRIARDSAYSLRLSFTKIANLGLTEQEQFKLEQDKRSWQSQYLLGLPGLVFGAVFGSLALAGIGLGKWCIHSFYSWLSLSGSFINLGLDLPVSSALAGDQRTTGRKLAGGLGYVLACLTTLPLSVVIFTFKKIVPIVVALVLGGITSPAVAGIKGIKRAFNKSRFDDLADETEQKFKNLYSILTPWGQLPENSIIQEGQNGRKGPICFVRKSVTFNISTVTEYTLDRLLIGYRDSKNKEAFFAEHGEFAELVAEIKAHYQALNCLESRHHMQILDEQIDNLGAFVKDYVQGKKNTVPKHLYANPKNSWKATFWGAAPDAKLRNEEPEVVAQP